MEFSLLGKAPVIGTGHKPKNGAASKWYLSISAEAHCNEPITISVGEKGLHATICGKPAYSVEHDFQGWTGIARCRKHHPKDKPVSDPTA